MKLVYVNSCGFGGRGASKFLGGWVGVGVGGGMPSCRQVGAGGNTVGRAELQTLTAPRIPFTCFYPPCSGGGGWNYKRQVLLYAFQYPLSARFCKAHSTFNLAMDHAPYKCLLSLLLPAEVIDLNVGS